MQRNSPHTAAVQQSNNAASCSAFHSLDSEQRSLLLTAGGQRYRSYNALSAHKASVGFSGVQHSTKVYVANGTRGKKGKGRVEERHFLRFA